MTEGDEDIGGVSIAPEVDAYPLFGKSHKPIFDCRFVLGTFKADSSSGWVDEEKAKEVRENPVIYNIAVRARR